MKAHPDALTWAQYEDMVTKEYVRNDYKLTPDGFKISSNPITLRAHPDAMTWAQYERMLVNGDQPRKVSQKVVDEAVADLKELLGRSPTPKEVEDFLQEMSEGANTGPDKIQNFDPFGFNPETPDSPYTMSDAIKEI